MTSSPGLQVASTPKNRNGLAPGRDDDAAGVDLEPAVAREMGGAGLPQHGQARRGAVVRLAVGPGLAARVDDVARRREVGLADLQVDDPAPDASSAFARASTSKADSVPRRLRLSASCIR